VYVIIYSFIGNNSLYIFNVLTVKGRPLPQYTFPFISLRFHLMVANTNGRNMLWKINEGIVFIKVLCSFWW